MMLLSAFADEISSDLHEQVEVLRSEGIQSVELRSVWDTNVLDLTDADVAAIRSHLDRHDMRVATIASPIGKTPIDAPFENVMVQLDRALALARAFDTRFIRVFSFYPPLTRGNLTDAQWMEQREQVLERLRVLTARAREVGVVLLHENEKGIYGDTISRNVDLLAGIDDPHFRSVLDPANYVQCGQEPYPRAYEQTRPWLAYVHVKDARADGRVVPAGEGDSDWPRLLQRLRADGYAGFLALEPHLTTAGQFQGFSGPERFRRAVGALRHLLAAVDVSSSGSPPSPTDGATNQESR